MREVAFNDATFRFAIGNDEAGQRMIHLAFGHLGDALPGFQYEIVAAFDGVVPNASQSQPQQNSLWFSLPRYKILNRLAIAGKRSK